MFAAEVARRAITNPCYNDGDGLIRVRGSMRCSMAMQPARQYMSFEQYLLLVNNSDRRYEYHDGEVRLVAGGSSNHAAISLNFGVVLDQGLGDDAVCRPYVTDKLVRVAPTRIVIPDVVVSCVMA